MSRWSSRNRSINAGEYNLRIRQGRYRYCSPGSTIPEGEIEVMLTDPAGYPLAGEPVNFYVAYGSGAFIQKRASGILKESSWAKARTNQQGVAKLPAFRLGLREGLNCIYVQSQYVTKEVLINGRHFLTKLKVIEPVPLPSRVTAGSKLTLRLKAVCSLPSGKEIPVKGLLLCAEVLNGWAVLKTTEYGSIKFLETAEDGTVRVDVEFGRLDEKVKLMVSSYWFPYIKPVIVEFELKSPFIKIWSHHKNPSGVPSVSDDAVDMPLRYSLEEHGLPVGTAKHPDLFWRNLSADVKKGLVEVEPVYQDTRHQQRTIFVKTRKNFSGQYEVELSLPDFPDSTPVTAYGQSSTTWNWNRVYTPRPGVSASGRRVYVAAYNGGSRDTTHQLRAGVESGHMQYLGPGSVNRAAISKPIEFTLDVLPWNINTSPKIRLKKALVKFKVRTSPVTSNIDDPTPLNRDYVPGKIGLSPNGPWHDEIRMKEIYGSQAGKHRFTIYFKNSEYALDQFVEMTVDVVMEEQQQDGTWKEHPPEPSGILTRAAILRPRVMFVRKKGNSFQPIERSDIWSISADNFRNPFNPQPDGFYVEALCEDRGYSLKGTLSTEDESIQITLYRVSSNEKYTLYRSGRCYVINSSEKSYGQGILIKGVNSRRVWAELNLEALHRDVKITTGQRPLGVLRLDRLNSSASLPRPVVILFGSSVPAWADPPDSKAVASRTSRVRVRLSGVVYDPAGELLGTEPELFINGKKVHLGRKDYSSTSRLRPKITLWRFKVHTQVEWGLQRLTIKARNSLGGTDELSLTLDIRRKPRYNGVCRVEAQIKGITCDSMPEPPSLAYFHVECPDAAQNIPAAIPVYVQSDARLNARQFQIAAVSKRALLRSTPFITVWNGLISGTAGRTTVPANLVVLRDRDELRYWLNRNNPLLRNETFMYGEKLYRTQISILKLDEKGRWVEASYATQKDKLSVRVRTRPGLGVIPLNLYVTDHNGLRSWSDKRPRAVSLLLKEKKAGLYELHSYYDFSISRHIRARAIRAVHDLEPLKPAYGEAFLWFSGSGRLVADAEGFSIPLFVEPRRTEITARVDGAPQEGLWPDAPRIGYLDSVVPSTGEMVLEDIDHTVTCRGVANRINRVYRAYNSWPGVLGQSWHAWWESFVWQQSKNTIKWLTPDGQIITFKKKGSGWSAEHKIYAVLEGKEGDFTVRLRNGIRLRYVSSVNSDSPIPVSSIEDRFGNRIFYMRRRDLLAIASQDEFERTLQYIIDDQYPLLKKAVDHTGESIQYSYDSSGYWLTQVRRRQERLKYSCKVKKNGVRPYIFLLQSVYTGSARRLSKLLDVGYDTQCRVARQKMAERAELVFRYGSNNLTWAEADHNGRVKAVLGKLHFSGSHPARFSSLIKKIELPNPNDQTPRTLNNPLTWVLEYNSYGEVTRRITPEGCVWSYRFDERAREVLNRGNLLKITLTAKNKVELWNTADLEPEYKPEKKRVKTLTWKFTYEPRYQMPTSYENPAGYSIDWFYDRAGRLTERGMLVKLWDGKLRKHVDRYVSYTYRYNFWGQLLEAVDPNGAVTKYEYYWHRTPVRGSMTTDRETSPGTFLARIVKDARISSGVSRAPHMDKPSPITTLIIPDPSGRPLSVIEQDMVTSETRYAYDRYRRLKEIEHLPSGLKVRYSYGYTKRGPAVTELIEVRDLKTPSGFKPWKDRIVKVKKYNLAGDLLEEDLRGYRLEQMEYDQHGRMKKHTVKQSKRAGKVVFVQEFSYYRGGYPREVVTGKKIKVNYTYDNHGRLKETRLGKLSVTGYKYDGFGRLAEETDSMGTIRKYFYDKAGRKVGERVTGKRSSGIRGLLSESITYYDLSDRVLAIKDTIIHDRTAKKYRIYRAGYDALGNRIWERLPSGVEKTVEKLDGHGRIRKIKDSFVTLGTDISLVNQIDHISSVDYRYMGTSVSEVIEQSGFKKSIISSNYDQYGFPHEQKLKVIEGQNSTPEILLWRRYYDNLGRVRFQQDRLGNVNETKYDRGGNVTARITYPASRPYRTFLSLKGHSSGTYGHIEKSVSYDAMGNILEVRDTSGNIAERYTYDSAGLMVAKEVATYPGAGKLGKTSFEYDNLGRIKKMVDPEGNVLSYSYDAVTGMLEKIRAKPSGVASYVGTMVRTFEYDGLGRIIRGSSVSRVSEVDPFTRRMKYRDVTCELEQRFDSTGRLRISEHSNSQLFNIKMRQDYEDEPWEFGRAVVTTYPGRIKTRIESDNGRPSVLQTKGVLGRGGWKDTILYSYNNALVERITYKLSDTSWIDSSFSYNLLAQPVNHVVDLRTHSTRKILLDREWKYNGAFLPSHFIDHSIKTGPPQASKTIGYEYDSLNRLEYVLHFGTKDVKEGPLYVMSHSYRKDGSIATRMFFPSLGWKNPSAGQGNWELESDINKINPHPEKTYQYSAGLPLMIIDNYLQGNRWKKVLKYYEWYHDPQYKKYFIKAKNKTSTFIKFDKRGNIIDDGENTYTYDAFNHLVEIREKKNKRSHRLIYDALGRVQGRSAPDSSLLRSYTWVGWLGDLFGCELSTTGNRLYIRGGLGEVGIVYTNGKWLYQVVDQNGRSVMAVNLKGGLEERYNPIDGLQVNTLDEGFKQLTKSSYVRDLLHYPVNDRFTIVGRRVLDYRGAQFLQRDTSILADPLNYGNPYAYAANNPVVFSDDGRMAFVPFLLLWTGAGMMVGVVSNLIFTGGENLAYSALKGAVLGAAGALGGWASITAEASWGLIAGFAVDVAAGVAVDIVDEVWRKGSISATDVLKSGIYNAGFSVAAYGTGYMAGLLWKYLRRKIPYHVKPPMFQTRQEALGYLAKLQLDSKKEHALVELKDSRWVLLRGNKIEINMKNYEIKTWDSRARAWTKEWEKSSIDIRDDIKYIFAHTHLDNPYPSWGPYGGDIPSFVNILKKLEYIKVWKTYIATPVDRERYVITEFVVRCPTKPLEPPTIPEEWRYILVNRITGESFPIDSQYLKKLFPALQKTENAPL